ncbi:hypothetical protein R1flu_028766 [Riccia fluitans]|uniref:HMA domain-containing protein n=1 Tax=Riccia fluitans TaxID=41844 RepID=A0ABD1XML4_9MARC
MYRQQGATGVKLTLHCFIFRVFGCPRYRHTFEDEEFNQQAATCIVPKDIIPSVSPELNRRIQDDGNARVLLCSEDQTEQQENTESTEYTEEDVEETDNSEHAEEDVEETDNSEDPAQDEAEGEVDHADDSSEEDEDEDEKESEVKLRVPMCCAVCESDVREVLEQLKGVNSVTCNYKKHKVKVTGTADHLQVLQACRRINGASYFWQDS